MDNRHTSGRLTRRKTWFNPSFSKVAVPSQAYDSFFLPVVPLIEMVQLPLGFVSACGLSLSTAPWSAVYLLLPLFIQFNY